MKKTLNSLTMQRKIVAERLTKRIQKTDKPPLPVEHYDHNPPKDSGRVVPVVVAMVKA